MAKSSKPAPKTRTTSAAKASLKTASTKASTAAPRKGSVAGKAAAAPASQANSLTPQVTMTLNHDQIAKRAFAIWVAKGRPQGQDEQNWKEAEALLARELAKRA